MSFPVYITLFPAKVQLQLSLRPLGQTLRFQFLGSFFSLDASTPLYGRLHLELDDDGQLAKLYLVSDLGSTSSGESFYSFQYQTRKARRKTAGRRYLLIIPSARLTSLSISCKA